MKKRHEVLFNQLESYRNELLSVVDTVSEEEAERIPAGFNKISAGTSVISILINIYGSRQ